MKNRILLLISLLLTLAALGVFAIMPGAAAPQVGGVAQGDSAESASDVQPDKLIAGAGFPGVYAARDWRKIDPSVYPVVGGHETFSWKELEPTEGVYDWSRLDSFILAQAGMGKKSAIGITTYNGRIEDGLLTPLWFDSANPSGLITCTGIQVPRYWGDAYKTKYGNFVNALASHLSGNGSIAYVQIGVGLYGETQPADDSDDQCIKDAMYADFGYTTDYDRTAKWIETVNSMTDRYVSAFAGGQRLFLVYTPRFINVCEKSEETLYAASKGVGLFAGGIYADTTGVLSVPPGGDGCQKWDPIIKWNGSPTATIPVAFESYHYMLPDATQFYWGVLGALNKHADYLSLESDLFFSGGSPSNPITENLDIMRMANLYLGKTAATAPNAWVAMRDTSPATNGNGCNKTSNYPQYGDYDYWLYRDDTVSGGRTITASNIYSYVVTQSGCGSPVGTVVNNAQYDPLLAGKGAQGMITRRTDHASGNDNMYFRVDDSFVSGQGITSAVYITVTYLDHGTDNWVLYYKNAAGAEKAAALVTKQNSGQWKTATFNVTDMSFAGLYGNGNDFRLWNGGIGDEYVHMVMIGKYRPPAPTPTATATSTNTPTATPTPITVVFQQGISPSPSYLGADDTFISNYGGDQNVNYGDSVFLALRNSDQRAALIKYDVSSIPGHAVIESATLSFYVDSQTNSNALPVELHKVRRTWAGNQATWMNATTATAWGLPGANDTSTDIDSSVVASTTLAAANYWQDFDVTAPVREWVQSAASNSGLIIKAGSAGNVEYHLRSNDYSTPGEYRPILTIKYRVPSGATPTSTRTATITQTPTRTPTQTPAPIAVTFQKGVSPSVDYSGVQDTFISNYGDPDANYGISPTLSLRNSDFKAGLIRFDTSSIAPTVNVLSATISVHVYNATNANPLSVQAYRMLRSWAETGATWNQAAASTAWNTPGANGLGADRDDVVLSNVTLTESGFWYDFDVTDLARLWVQYPGQNYGIALKTAEGGQVEYELWSSDYMYAPVVRPKLTIVYSTFFSGPTATATPSRTATPSPTPTRTQTPAPQTVVFQRGVAPSAAYSGVYDTFISNFGDTTTNYGISPTLELRSNDVRAALLRFDITSLPATASIVNASVSVHVDYKTNPFSIPVNLYRVFRGWGEMEATWVDAASGQPWGVSGANSGSDRATTATASLVMESANTWYEWDVTTLARLWLTSPADNKGVILKVGEGPSVAYGLRSSEYYQAPTYRPKLTIQCYNCQPPGAYRLELPIIISAF